MTTPRLFAHRGSSLLAPENTTAAFDIALHYQADVLETDVRLSKDGIVMVTHDETLERTTNGVGRVANFSATELKTLDTGCKFNDLNGHSFAGSRLFMLTLDELLEHYPNVGINIDIKDNHQIAAEAVANTLRKHQSRHKKPQWINVGSFHARVTKQFRLHAPAISTAATRQEVAKLVFSSHKRTEPAYRLLQIPVSYCGIQLTGNRFINKVHQLGCGIVYWTINDATQLRHLLSKGCDGVVTDRPDLALLEFKRLSLK